MPAPSNLSVGTVKVLYFHIAHRLDMSVGGVYKAYRGAYAPLEKVLITDVKAEREPGTVPWQMSPCIHMEANACSVRLSLLYISAHDQDFPSAYLGKTLLPDTNTANRPPSVSLCQLLGVVRTGRSSGLDRPSRWAMIGREVPWSKIDVSESRRLSLRLGSNR